MRARSGQASNQTLIFDLMGDEFFRLGESLRLMSTARWLHLAHAKVGVQALKSSLYKRAEPGRVARFLSCFLPQNETLSRVAEFPRARHSAVIKLT
jgi:hypothetical protein